MDRGVPMPVVASAGAAPGTLRELSKTRDRLRLPGRGRSASAARFLRSQGFANVLNLEGGSRLSAGSTPSPEY